MPEISAERNASFNDDHILLARDRITREQLGRFGIALIGKLITNNWAGRGLRGSVAGGDERWAAGSGQVA